MLTKSKPYSHRVSCLAKVNGLLWQLGLKFASLIAVVFYNFSLAFLFDRALYVITLSVLDVGVIYLWPWV